MSFSLAKPDRMTPLGWAAFLAASWTWCIGMFLPVLLVRDFGLWGWIVFAVPNVIGAAAMGWTIVSREHSLAFVTNHRIASQAFSFVTIGFHLFVITWLFNQLVGPLGAAIGVGLLLCVLLPLFITTIAVTVIAAGVLFVSVLMSLVGAGAGALSIPTQSNDPLGVMSLLMVCALGFAFCPYLDLTFHRARQECPQPAESRLAFGVGFGVMFFAMIVFTLLYAAAFISGRVYNMPVLQWTLAIHMIVQAMFTVGVHASALVGTCQTRDQHDRRVMWLTVCIVVPIIIAILVTRLETQKLHYLSGMTWGEVTYRAFLSFYGLLAPAYIWIIALPARGYSRPTQRDWLALAVTCLAACPFYWFAFMHPGRMEWVIPGVAIVLLGRLLGENRKRDYLSEARTSMPLGSHDPLHPDRPSA
jgi:hypothetical protein